MLIKRNSIKYPYANVNTPVDAGSIVNVFGDWMVNDAVDNVQKHNTLPAPAPVELRRTAYLILLKLAPDAVNTSPAVVYVNLYCLADAPTVHCAVAGGRLRPPATYPPVADISPGIDAHVDRVDNVNIDADALALCKHILNTPAPNVIVPLPIYFFAFA